MGRRTAVRRETEGKNENENKYSIIEGEDG